MGTHTYYDHILAHSETLAYTFTYEGITHTHTYYDHIHAHSDTLAYTFTYERKQQPCLHTHTYILLGILIVLCLLYYFATILLRNSYNHVIVALLVNVMQSAGWRHPLCCTPAPVAWCNTPCQPI